MLAWCLTLSQLPLLLLKQCNPVRRVLFASFLNGGFEKDCLLKCHAELVSASYQYGVLLGFLIDPVENQTFSLARSNSLRKAVK